MKITPKKKQQQQQQVTGMKLSLHAPFLALVFNLLYVTNLKRLGFEIPTHVQAQAIPVILSGRHTCQSATGTGKTVAYLAPIVHHLQKCEPRVQRADVLLVVFVTTKLITDIATTALVLVPTRELCMQVYEILQKLLHRFHWIVPGYIMGGENRSKEKARLRKGDGGQRPLTSLNMPGKVVVAILLVLAAMITPKFFRLCCVVLAHECIVIDVIKNSEVLDEIECNQKVLCNVQKETEFVIGVERKGYVIRRSIQEVECETSFGGVILPLERDTAWNRRPCLCDLEEEESEIKGITILVATPGRLLDHLKNTSSFLHTNLRWLILMKQIATLNEKVNHLAKMSLENPILVGLGEKFHQDSLSEQIRFIGSEEDGAEFNGRAAGSSSRDYNLPSQLNQRYVKGTSESKCLVVHGLQFFFLYSRIFSKERLLKGWVLDSFPVYGQKHLARKLVSVEMHPWLVGLQNALEAFILAESKWWLSVVSVKVMVVVVVVCEQDGHGGGYQPSLVGEIDTQTDEKAEKERAEADSTVEEEEVRSTVNTINADRKRQT
ncbi:DEAD-box ATP-dependent RNA helicase 17 [Bienertia sinuspersici]